MYLFFVQVHIPGIVKPYLDLLKQGDMFSEYLLL